MNILVAIGASIAVVIGAAWSWAYMVRKAKEDMPPPDRSFEPQPAPVTPPPPENLWDTPKRAWHSTRAICDAQGLTFAQKNEICATIYGESEFNNKAICLNKDKQGRVWSADRGLAQINDYFHVAPRGPFASSDDIENRPEKAVNFMISAYQTGRIDLWVAHKTGRYKQFLPQSSKMWTLAS